jgi:hypothetical protein
VLAVKAMRMGRIEKGICMAGEEGSPRNEDGGSARCAWRNTSGFICALILIDKAVWLLQPC